MPKTHHPHLRLLEAFDELYDALVDPAEAYFDSDGDRWLPLAGGSEERGGAHAPFTTERELREIRAQCRALAVTNEFAINAQENRLT